MSDIPIAYPILELSNIFEFNIIYNDSKYQIKYQLDNFIEITIIDKSYQIYQTAITKSNISLDKLYKLIINALNKEPNYLINVKYNENINIIVEYHNEVIDIVENIQLTKQLDEKPTETLLVDKIKELDDKIDNLEKQNKELKLKNIKVQERLLKLENKICIPDNISTIITYSFSISKFKLLYSTNNYCPSVQVLKSIDLIPKESIESHKPTKIIYKITKFEPFRHDTARMYSLFLDTITEHQHDEIMSSNTDIIIYNIELLFYINSYFDAKLSNLIKILSIINCKSISIISIPYEEYNIPCEINIKNSVYSYINNFIISHNKNNPNMQIRQIEEY